MSLSCRVVENDNDDDFSGEVSGVVAETNCNVVILLAVVVLRADEGGVVYRRLCTGDGGLAVVVICTVVEVMVTVYWPVDIDGDCTVALTVVVWRVEW